VRKIQNTLFIIGFKITWISCVLGELYFGSLFGFVVGFLFLTLFFYFNKSKFKFFYLILIFSSIGYLFDSLLVFFNLYIFNAEIIFLYLPLWFLVLWPSFCCLLIICFVFLDKYFYLSIILGSIFGPLSYYSGVGIGLLQITNYLVFIVISVFWFFYFFLFLKCLKPRVK
jgi:hypothetical protein